MKLTRSTGLYLLVAALSCVLYLLQFFSSWQDMIRVWNTSATYNHCYLIVPISLWYIWQNKHQSAPIPESLSSLWRYLPVAVVLLALLLWLFGYAADLALLMHTGTVLTLMAFVALLLGSTASWQHRFAIGYLVFLVPFGEELSPFLQNITADFTVAMLQLTDIPVYRDGLFLNTPVGLFEVAEACSGLRFLIASLAISVLFAELTYQGFWKKLTFVVFMMLVSVLANGVRAFMLVYIGEKSNMALGFGADHYLYGWLFFGAVLLAGFWFGARFADPREELSGDAKPRQLTATFPQLAALALLLICTLYTAQLDIQNAPEQPAIISLPDAETIDSSPWGIDFKYSYHKLYAKDNQGVEYFSAAYANRQQPGELIGWNNQLFNPQLWQVQQRNKLNGYAVLSLKNRKDEYLTVLYWYQVSQTKTGSDLTAKLHQAVQFLADDSSGASVNAVAIYDKSSAEIQQKLLSAAQRLSHKNSLADNATGTAP